MVHFASKLQAHKIVEWDDQYVRYTELKQQINKIKRVIRPSVKTSIVDEYDGHTGALVVLSCVSYITLCVLASEEDELLSHSMPRRNGSPKVQYYGSTQR